MALSLPVGDRTGRLLVRGVQLVLLGILAFGVARRDADVVVNVVGTLAVTELPALLRRNYRITLAPGLVLLIGVSVVLHAVGTLGPYQTVPWWDELAHGFSAAVVATAGYAAARAFDVRDECLRLPPGFLFAYVLLFVLAAGVAWELFEFATGGLSDWLGLPTFLGQPSLADTMSDLVFDAVGGLVAAALGTAYLRSGLVRLPGRGERQPGD